MWKKEMAPQVPAQSPVHWPRTPMLSKWVCCSFRERVLGYKSLQLWMFILHLATWSACPCERAKAKPSLSHLFSNTLFSWKTNIPKAPKNICILVDNVIIEEYSRSDRWLREHLSLEKDPLPQNIICFLGTLQINRVTKARDRVVWCSVPMERAIQCKAKLGFLKVAWVTFHVFGGCMRWYLPTTITNHKVKIQWHMKRKSYISFLL